MTPPHDATPERLARETGFTVEQWTAARDRCGDLWPLLWRAIAQIACVVWMAPDRAAELVLDDRDRSAAESGR